MKNITQNICLSLILIVGSYFSFAFAETPKVKYPSGYRNWIHVKSMIISEGHPLFDVFGGIHHIYANKSALKAMQNQTPYPDGAVFVFDLLEIVTKDNITAEGKRRKINVMQKDKKRVSNNRWVGI